MDTGRGALAGFDEIDLSQYKKRSYAREVWRRLRKNKVAMGGLIVFSVILLLLLCADLISDYQTMAIDQNIANRLQPPSREHWFGTDALGRDLFARVLHGGRVSIGVAMAIVVVSSLISLALGGAAAYFGGVFDGVLMRLLDVVMSIPGMLLTLALVAVLGQGIDKLLIALTISSVPSFTRITRAVVLKTVGSEYIEAARSNGASHVRVLVKYVLPNSIGPLFVSMAMSVAGNIMSIAGLSYIGLGIVAPAPEWGALLSEAKQHLRYNPYLCMIPGVAILLTALSLNLLGDGLRDALDPRLKD